MIQANIHEIKARLSEYLSAVEQGETVIIARRNVPVAELKPITPPRNTPRSIGQGPGQEGYELPDSFWEPLPDNLLKGFNGETVDSTRDSKV